MCIEVDRRTNSEKINTVKSELSALKRKIRLSAAKRVLQRDKEQKAAARRKVAAQKKAEKAKQARVDERNELRSLRRLLTNLSASKRELKARADNFIRY